jgi:hypothetical protein
MTMPAHLAITEHVKQHARNLAAVEQDIRKGGVQTSTRFMTAADLEPYRLQEIGGLSSLLEVLPRIDMAPEAVEYVLARLKEITYRHGVIIGAIERLVKRRGAPAPA